VQVDAGACPARGPIVISEYLGANEAFDRFITGFSERYADLNQRDFLNS